MKEIPDGSVDTAELDVTLICSMYKEGHSMRNIASKLGTNHKKVSKILKNYNIETRKPLNLRGKRKFECDKELLYNNMATHLRFDVDYKWLSQFEDSAKLKVLHACISERGGRFDVDTVWYKGYILKFYSDKQFNLVYTRWVSSDYLPYKKPSLDHIVPKSKGGTNSLDNLQFLSWFENRSKNNMSQGEWDNLKCNIEEYFV